MEIRKETFHPEKCVKESVGIMHGCRMQHRKNRKIAFRIGGTDKIKVIAMIKAGSGRIPSDITVRLREVTLAVAVINTF